MPTLVLSPVPLLPDSPLLCFVVPGAFPAQVCARLLSRPLVQLQLLPTTAPSGSPLVDDLYVYFDAYARDSYDDQLDAEKFPNSAGLFLATVP